MFDPCPSSLQSSRLASWKCPGGLGGSWLDATGNYSLTNNGTVTPRRASAGRTFIGPACYYDWSLNQCWSTTDSALMPTGNWTFAGLIWHDNASNFTAVQMLHMLFATRSSGSLQSQYCVFQSGDFRRRLFLQRTSASSTSVYFDTLPAGDWLEPLVVGICQNSGTSQVAIHAVGFLSGTLIASTTQAGLLATADTLLIGRYQTGAAATYNSTRHIGDCYTIASAAWSLSDVQAYRTHLFSQRKNIEGFLRGQSA